MQFPIVANTFDTDDEWCGTEMGYFAHDGDSLRSVARYRRSDGRDRGSFPRYRDSLPGS